MSEKKVFQASAEAKGKAKQLRMFAIIVWLLAMVGQGFTIYKLISEGLLVRLTADSSVLIMFIVAIVVILALAITGSSLWKKANRLDPASEKNKTKFFIQNQLGAIMNVLAFLPLVILIFMNKDADKKTKGIAGSIAVVALLIAGISGVDFAPPSVEKYTEEINAQTKIVKSLNHDQDNVYWTRAGNKYHIFKDCQHIVGREEINNGTTKESWDEKGISELCKTCESRAKRQLATDG